MRTILGGVFDFECEGIEKSEQDGIETLTFEWAERHYAFPNPQPVTDVHFVLVHGVDISDSTLEIVLLRRRTWWQSLKRMLSRAGRQVGESEAQAEPLDGGG